MRLHQLAVTVAFIGISFSAIAQKKELGDDQYFKGNFKGITQPLPQVTEWVDDGHFILKRGDKNFLVNAKDGSETEAPPKEIPKGSVQSAPEIVNQNSDLYVRMNVGDIRLTNDKDKENNPTLSPDNKYVAYTKNNNLYTVNIETKKETQLTTDGSDVILNGYASWVYMEEILGRATAYRAFWWSPDSRHLAYFRSDDSKVPVFTITDGTGQHGLVEKERYPKVGDPNPEVKVGIVSPDGGATVWSDFNAQDDQYFGAPYWKPDGTLLVQWMDRLQETLIIYEVDLASGNKKEFYKEHQKTWVDLDDGAGRIKFLKNGKGFILFSDQTGWKHIYYYDMSGKLINAITSGKFTVTNLNYIDEKNSIVYFTARCRENSATRDLYRVDLNGKNLQRLTFGNYTHNTNASPNYEYFVTTYNNVSTPNKMALVNNKGKLIKELGDAKGLEYDNYNMAKTEIIRVKSDDGLFDLPMRVTWPLNMEPGKKYPVLINIYGGPDAGSVGDNFQLGGNQQWYAKEGLIQVVMDHRASGHFGKEGVNYMYHNLGYWETKDYSTMVKYLIANGSADPKKICITGFSYGGYMTCYALTYGSDVFTHGMAGGSVTDWTLYDSHYTERYMGTPANNAEGYKSSSALTHADKYKGVLQIVHGVIDDNVHMQNSLQLISKLEDAKKDFEFMLYPGGRHGWGGAKGAHFQNLKTKFIYKYLLEKPVPQQLLR